MKIGWRSPARTDYFIEFPEHLGAHAKGTPASPWQGQELRAFIEESGGSSRVHNNCQWGISVLKPERTASTLAGHKEIGFEGWPQMNESGRYVGPLPSKCPHGGHPSVGGRMESGTFETSKLAAFSIPFNQFVARMILNTVAQRRIGALFETGNFTGPDARLSETTMQPNYEEEPTDEETPFAANSWPRHGAGPPVTI